MGKVEGSDKRGQSDWFLVGLTSLHFPDSVEETHPEETACFKLTKTLLELTGFRSQITLDWRSVWSCRAQSRITGVREWYSLGSSGAVVRYWKLLANPWEGTWTFLPTISRYRAHQVTRALQGRAS